MNKKLKFFLLFCFFAISAPLLKAQFIAIPDSNFAYWLNVNIPAAMNGNLMDTTHVQVTTRTIVTLKNKAISSLEGIQYFDALQQLFCDSNLLVTLPVLPNTVNYLTCDYNQLISLPVLPNSLRALICQNNYITSLGALPDSLTLLICQGNQWETVHSIDKQ